MDASIPHLDKLLELLAEKTNQPLDVKGLKEMSEAAGLTEKYLYEHIHRKKEKARKDGQATISVQSGRLDIVAQFLGFKSYQSFTNSIDRPLDPILLALVGNYYSYVRRNDELGFILRSPVCIYEETGKILFELKGPMRLYSGEVKLKHGCLFIILEEVGGKQIHHVYKIGTRQKPEVLQGIFSGVSTNFDPIGGRTVLVRVEDEFEKLINKEAQLEEFFRSTIYSEKSVSLYLKEFSINNLRINRVINYGIADLEA